MTSLPSLYVPNGRDDGRGHGKNQGFKRKRPARSYRNSGYGKRRSSAAGGRSGGGQGGRRDTSRTRYDRGGSGRGGRGYTSGSHGRHGRRDDDDHGARPRRRQADPIRDDAARETRANSEFYMAMREKIFEMLGGKVCSGCGFRDERALGIASKYGDVQFDSTYRGGAVASSWSRYAADPDLAASELVVLCLNCNRIREPIFRTRASGSDTGEKGRTKARKNTKQFPR